MYVKLACCDNLSGLGQATTYLQMYLGRKEQQRQEEVNEERPPL